MGVPGWREKVEGERMWMDGWMDGWMHGLVGTQQLMGAQ